MVGTDASGNHDQASQLAGVGLPESVIRALFDSNPLPMWIYDLQTLRFLAVNDSAIAHYGYTRAEFLSMSIADIRPGEDMVALLANIARVEDDVDRAGVWRHLKQDGALIHVEITSHPLDFMGRKAELVIAYDVSARVAAESELHRLAQLEALIADVSRDLLRCEALGESIDRALLQIGTFSTASRAYLFGVDLAAGCMSNTHEWCAAGVTPHKAMLQDLKTADFPWFLSQLRDGRTLPIPDVDALPPEAENERTILEQQGIRSMITVPILSGGELSGFLGFDNVVAAEPWHPDNQRLLGMAAEVLGAALQRRRDREALQLSAQRMDSIMRSAAHFVFYRLAMDPGARQGVQVEFASESLHDIIGVEPDAPFDSWFTQVHADDLPGLQAENTRATGNGTVLDITLRILHLHRQQWRWIRVVSNPERDIQGKVTHYNGFMVDVTDMVDASQALKEERDFASAVMDTVGALVVVLDSTGRVVQFNRACEQTTGYTFEEVRGRPVWDFLIPPGEQENVQRVFRELKVTPTPSTFENHWLSKDGRELLISWSNTAIQDGHGRLLYGIGTGIDITELRRAHDNLEKIASYDTLTNLPNRRLFRDRLEHAIAGVHRHAQQLALLYLDLDNFKRVNDSLGHDIGDILLCEVALRLSRCVRAEDTVARLGGDEFVILLQTLPRGFNVDGLANKILQRVKEPIIAADHEVVVTCSIGITLAPADSMDPGILLRNADLAMYRSKGHGRDGYEYFEGQMNVEASRRLSMEAELRKALKDGQLEPFFQPIVGLRDMQIVGFEALARWQHPQRGFIPPDEFIPVAEDCGLIVPIGEYLLERAASDVKQLREAHAADLYVAVNLSARQAHDAKLVDTIIGVLARTGLTAEALRLEITESLLMKDFDVARHLIERLRNELGTRIAIDDFGTGYSSLSYLKRLPIDTLKIDRGFVADIPIDQNDMEITAAIIAMAQALNKDVVAEGIETLAQMEFLQARGCQFGQGYLFGRPAAPRTYLTTSLNVQLLT